MSARKTATGVVLGALLALALACYRVAYIATSMGSEHLEGAAVRQMVSTYDALREFRKRNGRWPKALSVVMGGTGVDPSCSYRPFLYFPGAKPGTGAILLAQPEAIKVGLWPFITIERMGVRADGKLVDVRGDGQEAVAGTEKGDGKGDRDGKGDITDFQGE